MLAAPLPTWVVNAVIQNSYTLRHNASKSAALMKNYRVSH